MAQPLISRRTVLRGLGAMVALPWLEAMAPLNVLASTPRTPANRLAFLYVPNGIHMPDWRPKDDGPLTDGDRLRARRHGRQLRLRLQLRLLLDHFLALADAARAQGGQPKARV
jgi:hypothetical protein